MAYLDFQDISKRISFKSLLDQQETPYEETERELKGQFDDGVNFIVNKEKNLFLCPYDKERKGSVINFFAAEKGIGLRLAAERLQIMFLKEKKEPEREIPELTLHYDAPVRKLGLSQELAVKFEVGLVKQHSVMAGKVTFLLRDETGAKVGYIGLNKDGSWFFPKGHKQEHLYNLHRVEGDTVVLAASPVEVINHYQQGTPAVALMSASMTEAQEKLLLRFEKIFLSLKNPDNIRNRLCRFAYVKVEQPS